MYGVTFGMKHSQRDFGFIMNSAVVGFPEVKTNYVDIPGGNGSIDLTEATGGVRYGDRIIDFKFTVSGSAEKKILDFQNELHGTKTKIVLDRDKEYYYLGRCLITEIKFIGEHLYEIGTQAKCNPFKYHNKETVHIVQVDGTKAFFCINDKLPAIPKIEPEGDFIMQHNGESYKLESGKTYRTTDIMFEEKYNRIELTGTGSVKFTYQEGAI